MAKCKALWYVSVFRKAYALICKDGNYVIMDFRRGCRAVLNKLMSIKRYFLHD